MEAREINIGSRRRKEGLLEGYGMARRLQGQADELLCRKDWRLSSLPSWGQESLGDEKGPPHPLPVSSSCSAKSRERGPTGLAGGQGGAP